MSTLFNVCTDYYVTQTELDTVQMLPPFPGFKEHVAEVIRLYTSFIGTDVQVHSVWPIDSDEIAAGAKIECVGDRTSVARLIECAGLQQADASTVNSVLSYAEQYPGSFIELSRNTLVKCIA